jgi:hypothetical protein
MNDVEFRKCLFDFEFFASSYLRVMHPRRGLINFEIHPFHERLIDAFSREQFIIMKKFRQGGFSTFTLAWLLWKAMFQNDQKIVWVSRTDRDAIATARTLSRFIRNLPEWLAPVMKKDNAHTKEFMDTGSSIHFGSLRNCCTKSFDCLILDECAFFEDMEECWPSCKSQLSKGKCVALSTVNGRNNWFEKTYTNAELKQNTFLPIHINYLEHPDYNNEEWATNLKGNLGLEGWTQEILCSFD